MSHLLADVVWHLQRPQTKKIYFLGLIGADNVHSLYRCWKDSVSIVRTVEVVCAYVDFSPEGLVSTRCLRVSLADVRQPSCGWCQDFVWTPRGLSKFLVFGWRMISFSLRLPQGGCVKTAWGPRNVRTLCETTVRNQCAIHSHEICDQTTSCAVGMQRPPTQLMATLCNLLTRSHHTHGRRTVCQLNACMPRDSCAITADRLRRC